MTAAFWAPIVMAAVVVALARATPGRDRTLESITGRAEAPKLSGPATPIEVSCASRRTSFVGPVLVVVVIVLAVIVLGLLWAVVGCGVAVGARAMTIRRQRGRRIEAIDRAVPDLVDLLVLAAGVGHPVRSCIDAVADRAPPELRPALVRARQRCQYGVPLSTALEDLAPQLGTQGPALVEAMIASHVSGAPLAEPLAHLAEGGRDLRRRAAEVQARRLPVTLLLPLVCCILPAFALLAVVPLLAGSLAGLRP